MIVAHIAFQYGLGNTGGAAIAATRLHNALLAGGVDSHYICIHAHESGRNVHQLPRGLCRYLFMSLTKVLRCVWRATRYRESICLNLVPLFGLEKLLRKINPDVVHVQWINADVMSFAQLKWIGGHYGMVVNLHDLWMLNAIEPHPKTDNRYLTGFNRGNSSLIERFIFMRKRIVVQSISPVFIGPSDWVCACCRGSMIGRGCDAVAIPNIIDARFVFRAQQVKRHSEFTILFGAFRGRSCKAKGFDDLAAALSILPEAEKKDWKLLVFGESASECSTSGVPTTFLGPIKSVEQLALIYHSADVLAFPSREETQGMVKVEAMACGLPVVAFRRTACAEGIVEGVTGWVAEDGDVSEYAGCLRKAYVASRDADVLTMKSKVANVTNERFSSTRIISRVRDVYTRACDNAK